jgi:hypothetical protein
MNQNCTIYWSKYRFALNPGLGGVGSNMCISITAHEQALSNRACNIFIFGGFQSSLFNILMIIDTHGMGPYTGYNGGLIRNNIGKTLPEVLN